MGTGAGIHHGIGPVTANSEARAANVWGVLQLSLADGAYEWKFISTGGSFRDSGSGRCHAAPR